MMTRRSRYLLVSVLLAGCGGSGGGGGPGGGVGIGVPPAVTPEPQGPVVARQWNDLLLEAIRNDYARPT